MIIRSRAPLRLGLAGGGTDVSPFCDLHGGLVLNATIDKYAYATIVADGGASVQIAAADQMCAEEHPLGGALPPGGKLAVHKAVYNRVMRELNGGGWLPLKLTTFVDAPAGSGLGSSSTLVVAIVKAFVEMLNLPLGDYDIAQLAYEIERIELGMEGGRQDQYAATFGGVSFMEFRVDQRVVVNPLRIKPWILCELEASLLLYFTGVSRDSAQIIGEQICNASLKQNRSVDAMHELKRYAQLMKDSLLRGDLRDFAEGMEKSWHAKKFLSDRVSNEQIDSIYSGARAAGALAGKVSGAGGGGFMMFIVDPVRKMDLARFLSTREGRIELAHFTFEGAQSWRIDEPAGQSPSALSADIENSRGFTAPT